MDSSIDLAVHHNKISIQRWRLKGFPKNIQGSANQCFGVRMLLEMASEDRSGEDETLRMEDWISGLESQIGFSIIQLISASSLSRPRHTLLSIYFMIDSHPAFILGMLKLLFFLSMKLFDETAGLPPQPDSKLIIARITLECGVLLNCSNC